MVDYICTACGYVGEPKVRLTRGSQKVEIFMWLWLVPGPFYSFWRRLEAERRCPHCSTKDMLSTKSMEGFELMQKAEKGEVEFALEQKIHHVAMIEAEDSSFKGCIVKRDIKQEIAQIADEKKYK